MTRSVVAFDVPRGGGACRSTFVLIDRCRVADVCDRRGAGAMTVRRRGRLRLALVTWATVVAVSTLAASASAQTPLPAGTVAGTITSANVPFGGVSPVISGAATNTPASPDTTTITLGS